MQLSTLYLEGNQLGGSLPELWGNMSMVSDQPHSASLAADICSLARVIFTVTGLLKQQLFSFMLSTSNSCMTLALCLNPSRPVNALSALLAEADVAQLLQLQLCSELLSAVQIPLWHASIQLCCSRSSYSMCSDKQQLTRYCLLAAVQLSSAFLSQ